MEIGEAVGRYEQAAALLPSRWQQAARRVPEHRKAQAEEFRLRAGRPMTLLTCEGELLVSDELPRQSVTQADLEQLCDAVTGYSRYAAAETMGKGYLIGRGGFRIGLCGTVAVRVTAAQPCGISPPPWYGSAARSVGCGRRSRNGQQAALTVR